MQTLNSENTPKYGAATSGDVGATSTEGGEPPAAPAAPAEATAPVIDLDAMGDHLVPVSVGKEIKHVPLSEVRNGLMMQADYSRKTQALKAAEAANEDLIKIGSAFQNDPQGTLEKLAATYGVGSSSGTSDSAEAEYRTPEEKAIADNAAQLADLQRQLAVSEQRQQLETQLNQLESVVGVENVDREALLGHASRKGITNLQAAYADLNFDLIAKGADAQRADAARQAVIDDKRDAQVVSQGGTTASGTNSGAVEAPKSIAEAFQMAKDGQRLDPAAGLTALPWITQTF